MTKQCDVWILWDLDPSRTASTPRSLAGYAYTLYRVTLRKAHREVRTEEIREGQYFLEPTPARSMRPHSVP